MARLATLLSSMCLNYTDLAYLCHLVPFLPIPIRKAIMTLCRVQQSPWSNPRVHRSMSAAMSFRFVATIRNRTSEKSFIDDVLPIILDYTNDPIILGFISMIIRVIPLDEDTSARQELESTIQKELSSCLGEDRPMTLDYRCLFAADADSRKQPILQDTYPRPLLASRMHDVLRAWKVPPRSRHNSPN
jgi:hypothetical protein